MMKGFIEKGNIDLETFATFPDPGEVFELYRKEGIAALRGTLDATPLHFVAADGYAHHMRQELMEIDETLFALFLRYHLATCERQDLIGYSNHTLDILRKNGAGE